MVSCINLQRSIPEKNIFSGIGEIYLTQYEKVVILGDFNIEAENKVMKDFLQEHTFYNMMNRVDVLKVM